MRDSNDFTKAQAALAVMPQLAKALQVFRAGTLSPSQLSALFRQEFQHFGGLLPTPYGSVLGDLLDRLESGALFAEESCSFSQADLADQLQIWLDKTQARLQTLATPSSTD